jgi:hypothetical protein
MDMTALNKQELEIIHAFSSVEIPEKIIRDSNIRELIHGMRTEQEAVRTDAQKLERLRQEKKEGNFIGNMWHGRDDKVQDAQIDLNKTIGRLTEKSSQLLIVNTVISKVLNDQQHILLEQQNILKQQTDTLEAQNCKILEQQKLLEKQQQDINKANQGLMEAKGITQEQAQQLVGCVKLVKEAESRISADNQSLRSGIEQKLHDSVEQCLGRLNSGFAEQELRYDAFEQQVLSVRETINGLDQKHDAVHQDHAKALQAQRDSLMSNLQRLEVNLNDKAEVLNRTEAQLTHMRVEQQKSVNNHRLAIAAVACLALASLGWQVAQYFALV